MGSVTDHEVLYRIDDIGKFAGDLIFIECNGVVWYKVAEGPDFGSVVSVLLDGLGKPVAGPVGWIEAPLQHRVVAPDPIHDRRRGWSLMRKRARHRS